MIRIILAILISLSLLLIGSCNITVHQHAAEPTTDHTDNQSEYETEPVVIEDTPVSSDPIAIERDPRERPQRPQQPQQPKPEVEEDESKPLQISRPRPIDASEGKPVSAGESRPEQQLATERPSLVRPERPAGETHSASDVKPQEKPKDMIQEVVDFSFSMFNNLSNKNRGENMSFSPVSLNIAFAMVYAGAKERTRKEISETFGFPMDNERFLNDFGSYHKYLASLMNDKDIEFNLANRVFIEKTYKILSSYESNISRYFEGAFEQINFRGNPRESEKHINKWVEEMTRERIKDLLPFGTIDNLTRMVLVNAIYIKSDWKYPFKEEKTEEKPFFKSKRNKVSRDFMIQQKEGIQYAKVGNNAVIELAYNTPQLSLMIILPDESNTGNIHNLDLDLNDYQEIMRSLSPKEVYMEIPKFKIESDFDLQAPLEELGVRSAFLAANFSGISGKRDLEISDVIQKVFFEIDEKGSEAAAATAIVMRTTSMMPGHDKPKVVRFIANRPFVFILKENTFNTPLFIGQYAGGK